MIGCKYAIYLKIDFILDCLQFEEPMGKKIYTSKQLRIINWPSNQGQTIYLKTVKLQQSKQPIWERLECNQPAGQLTKQLVTHKHKYKHPPWGQSWSEVWIKS